jgi:hypothetical protein
MDEEQLNEKIENAESLQDIEALKAQMFEEEKEVEEKPEETEETKEETPEEIEKKVEEVKEDKPEEKIEDKAEEKPAPAAPQGQAQDKAQLIDDDFIAKQPEANRKMLQNVKGEYMSPKALDIYINAQRLIGKKQQAAQEKQVKLNEIAQNPPAVKEVPQAQKDIPSYVDAEVYKELKRQFPELPSDPKERRTYLNEKNVEDGMYVQDVLRAEQAIRTDITKQVEQFQYIQNNATEINDNLIDTQLETIKSNIGQFGLDVKEDLGIDLGNEEDVKKLLFDSQGNLDRSMVTYIGGTAIIKENALTLKFMSQYLPKVSEKLKEKQQALVAAEKAKMEAEIKKARKDGFESANKKKPNSTLAAAKIGKQDDIELTDEVIEGLDSSEAVKNALARFKF